MREDAQLRAATPDVSAKGLKPAGPLHRLAVSPRPAGHRNGYRLGRGKTTQGQIEFGVPQLTETPGPFRSKINQLIRGRTEELARLALKMYGQGLWVRDKRGGVQR